MRLLVQFLALSLFLTVAPSVRDASSRLCSSEFKDELHHLNNSGVHVTLHHPRSPCSPAPLPKPLPFSTLLLHDSARAAHLTSLASEAPSASARHPTPHSVSAPLNPGDAVGIGDYIASINVGTPSKPYIFIVDTGSSLSWLQCLPCAYCHAQADSIYDPSASVTYSSVPCTTPECDSLLTVTFNPSACTLDDACIFEASYGDGSFSRGILSKDTVFFGGLSFPGVLIGCGEDNEGIFGQSDGLIGLSRNPLSFFGQLAPRLGYSFSYCLSTPSSTGYLSIGPYNAGLFSFTPLGSVNSLYGVTLASISVAGRPLAVGSSSYTSLPTIIDSGTVITRLPSDVYSALSAAVAAALKGVPKAPAYSILDTCYHGQASTLPVPTVSLVYQGGAAMRLPPGNVMIDVNGSTTCLAFAATSDTTVIGNTQQQTFAVAYDVAQSRIGFAHCGCS